MGDKILTGQRTARQRGREQARRELSQPHIFTGPDLLVTEYEVWPSPGVLLAVGDILDAYPGGQADEVSFISGTQVAGRSTGEPAARLRKAMTDTGREAVRVRIIAVSQFGVGTARIVTEDGDEGCRD